MGHKPHAYSPLSGEPGRIMTRVANRALLELAQNSSIRYAALSGIVLPLIPCLSPPERFGERCLEVRIS